MPRRSKLINIIIADASARIRKELAGLFSKLDGVKIVAQAEDADQTLKLTRKHKPRVVVLDPRMLEVGGGDGIGILRKLKSCKPPPTVAALTYYPYSLHRALCHRSGWRTGAYRLSDPSAHVTACLRV